MSIFHAILLGALQGFTEFLPVSSSGHLVLVQELLHINHAGDISFEVFVHFGTFISVIVAFRKDVFLILNALLDAIRNPVQAGQIYKNNLYFRLAVFVLLGSIPAAVVGLRFEHFIDELFGDPKLVAMMLMITAFILFMTRFVNPPDTSDVTLRSAIIIGIAQAIAIIPGISRAGSTISAGLFSGVSRKESATFSFLLALPVIFGATLLKAKDLIQSPPPAEKLLTLLTGTVVAAICGYFAITLLMGVLRKRKFSWFAYYCFIIGVIGILFIG